MRSFGTQTLATLLLFGVLLFAAQGAVSAATPPAAPPAPPASVISIEIRDFTADALGTMLVQRTRDSFADDKRFLLTSSEPNRVVVRLYTRGVAGKDPQTAYSFTVTFKLADREDEIFAGNTIGTCNQKEVPADAKGIVSMTWDQVSKYSSLADRVRKK